MIAAVFELEAAKPSSQIGREQGIHSGLLSSVPRRTGSEFLKIIRQLKRRGSPNVIGRISSSIIF
jgi:hypothetical protein